MASQFTRDGRADEAHTIVILVTNEWARRLLRELVFTTRIIRRFIGRSISQFIGDYRGDETPDEYAAIRVINEVINEGARRLF